jgi:hypothetical protein
MIGQPTRYGGIPWAMQISRALSCLYSRKLASLMSTASFSKRTLTWVASSPGARGRDDERAVRVALELAEVVEDLLLELGRDVGALDDDRVRGDGVVVEEADVELGLGAPAGDRRQRRDVVGQAVEVERGV